MGTGGNGAVTGGNGGIDGGAGQAGSGGGAGLGGSSGDGGVGGATGGGAGLGGAAGTGGIPGNACGVTVFSHHVLDAEYSKTLDRIVTIGDTPNELHAFDPITHADSVVSLPLVPTAVSVGPGGLQAAVGHDGYISIVDLMTAKLVATINVPTKALDVVLASNGYAYVFPKQDQWESIYSVNLASGVTTQSSSIIYAGTLARLHPSGTAMYGADNGLSPSDIEKYDISQGVAQMLYDSPYHGDYYMCGNLWFSEDGKRIFTRCGNVFHSSALQANDMTYNGSLNLNVRHVTHSSITKKVYAIGDATLSADDSVIKVFDDAFLAPAGTLTLPCFVPQPLTPSRGRFVFVKSDGTKVFAVVQANPGSGVLKDYGVVSF